MCSQDADLRQRLVPPVGVTASFFVCFSFVFVFRDLSGNSNDSSHSLEKLEIVGTREKKWNGLHDKRAMLLFLALLLPKDTVSPIEL